jgi:hypothetical protein
MKKSRSPRPVVVERVQTGVRMEKRILKVSRALADLLDLSLGDLLEGVLLHVFEGKAPFGSETLRKIAELKRVYGLELGAGASHRMKEAGADHTAARLASEALDRLRPLRSRTSSTPGAGARKSAARSSRRGDFP